jgi:nucleoid-associated protein YgaU
MSGRRLAVATATMALIALVLAALTPDLPVMAGALGSPQRTADTVGPEALVVSSAGLLAWAVWAWGAVGLALTAATALPGVLGGGARLLQYVVLPAGARRSAALALGIGLGVAAPLLGTATGLPVLTSAAAASSESAVPDWPAESPAIPTAVPDSPSPAPATQTAAVVPDWPAEPDVSGAHVVVRGDCLWHIAATRLLDQLGRPPSDGELATEVRAWWTANADVIGPDPDLLLPGQVLHPPPSP